MKTMDSLHYKFDNLINKLIINGSFHKYYRCNACDRIHKFNGNEFILSNENITSYECMKNSIDIASNILKNFQT